MNVSFRVSTAYDNKGFDDVIKPIVVHASKCIIYYHDLSDNPHLHGLVKGYSKTAKWFRDTLKKQFGLTAKTQYSCKFDSNDDFISYMSKGKLDPVYNYGYSLDEVNEYKSKGYDKGTDIVKAPKVNEDGKKTKWEMLQDMIDTCAKCGCGEYPTQYPKCVLKHIIRVIRKNKQVIGEYKVKDYYDAVSMYQNEGDFIDRLCKKIFPDG